MNKAVWIANHKVDMQRGEVTIAQTTRAIEPRALSVLRVLIAANGDVVTQQQLLDEVWGEVVVAPNALQRCITQLRKVFDDNAKQQLVIKTHPKLGYSLVATVSSAPIKHSIAHYKRWLGVLFMLVAVGLSTIYYQQEQSVEDLSYTKLLPLTSSDAAERGSALSENNLSLAFIRRISQNNEQLVVRDMMTGEERVLLQHQRFKGGLSFADNGLQISYATIETMHRVKCSRLMSVNIATKIEQQLLGCDDAFNHSPQWLDPQQLIFIRQAKNGNSELIQLNLADSSQQHIGGLLGNVEGFSYSKENRIIALTIRRKQSSTLLLAKFEGQYLRRIKSWPLLMHIPVYPQWQTPSRIVLAHQQSIFWFDLNGEQGQLSILSHQDIRRLLPYDKQMIVELGQRDIDVVQQNYKSAVIDSEIVARSPSIERSAQFKPHSDAISMLSQRSGLAQIWITDQGSVKQLTHHHSAINSYLWSSDGHRLVYLVGGELFYLDLKNGKTSALFKRDKVIQLMQWVTDKTGERLLLNVLKDDRQQVVSLNLNDLSLSIEYDGTSNWAQYSDNNELFIDNEQGNVLLIKQGKLRAMPALNKMKLQWRYYWRQGRLYMQDKHFTLWSFDPTTDLTTEQLVLVGQYDEQAIMMTDISPSKFRLLSDKYIGDKTELMLLR